MTYAPVKDINFKSAKRLKNELDDKIDNSKAPDLCNTPEVPSTASCVPTDEEMGTFFCKVK